MAVVTSIMRAHQLFLARANEVLRPFDLSFARYEVLAWVAWNEACGSPSLSQLAEQLQVTPSTVTSAIDRLEADGLLRRVPHPSDARTTLAEITRAGRDLVAAATAELNAKVFGALHLSPRERETLIELLREVRAQAGDVRAQAGARAQAAGVRTTNGKRRQPAAVQVAPSHGAVR